MKLHGCKSSKIESFLTNMKTESVIEGYNKALFDKTNSKVSINNFHNGYTKCLKSKTIQYKKIINQIQLE